MADEHVTRRSVLDAFASRRPQPTRQDRAAPDRRRRTNKSGLSVMVVENLAALEPYVSAWEDLADAAIEPNVFYEPWMLMPAIRAFGAGRRALFALILAPNPARPLGPPLWPASSRSNSRVSIKGWVENSPSKPSRLWRNKYCFLCTPLIRAGYGREAIAAFFDWLAAAITVVR